MLPFHHYITANQIWTNHYFNSTPMAASNDVKSAQNVRDSLLVFMQETDGVDADAFQKKYNALLLDLQHDVSKMKPTPVVSLSAAAASKRQAKRLPKGV